MECRMLRGASPDGAGRRGRPRPALAAVVAALGLMAMPTAAHAFTVYNNTDHTVHAEVFENDEPNRRAVGHDFKVDIPKHSRSSCNYTSAECGDGTRDLTMQATISIGAVRFACNLKLKAGGFVSVRQHVRTYQPSMSTLTPEYYCDSRYTRDDGSEQQVQIDPRGIGATKRNVLFLATADPQYENGDGASGSRDAADGTLKAMRGLLGSGGYRGAIVAGDLTQNTRTVDEWKDYRAAIDDLRPDDQHAQDRGSNEEYWQDFPGGLNRYFYDTMGNHDVFTPTDSQDQACDIVDLNTCVDSQAIAHEIRTRYRSTPFDKNGVGYGADNDPDLEGPGLYSWDWDDVHFVNLGLMPSNLNSDRYGGDDSAAVKCAIPDLLTDVNGGLHTFSEYYECEKNVYAGGAPGRALAFLKDDLAANVGTSGRPVVLVEHYGLDNFSIGRTCAQDVTPYTIVKGTITAKGKCSFQTWWTAEQRKDLWVAIQDYNVTAMISGHLHLGDTATKADWKVSFDKPDPSYGGPASIPDYVVGAAQNGAFFQFQFLDDGGCNPGADQTCLGVSRFIATTDGSYLLYGTDLLTVSAPEPRYLPTVSVQVSPNSPPHGTPVSFTAAVTDPDAPAGTPAPTGTVSYSLSGVDVAGCQDLALTATCTKTAAGSDGQDVEVSYSGDSSHAAATGHGFLDVQSGVTTTTVAGATVVSGEKVTLTSKTTVAAPAIGPVTGTVTFYNDTAKIPGCIDLAPVAGVATCDARFTVEGGPLAGRHVVTVDFNDERGDFLFSTAAADVTVNRAGTNMTLSGGNTVSGEAVTFDATVLPVAPGSGTPTGTVTFADNGTAIPACTGRPLTAGAASCSQTYAAPGSHAITATYNGDGEFKTSTIGLTHVVDKAQTTTTLTSSANPSVTHDPVTFTAQVAVTAPGAGTLGGTVDFTDGTATLCSASTVPASGKVTCLADLANTGAAHTIKATYSGTTALAGSSDTLSQSVTGRPTTTTLVSSANPSVAGQSVTVTATVAATRSADGTPGGQVSFSDGTTPIAGCQDLSAGGGSADCTLTPSLAGSPHHIRAVFAANSNWATSEGTLDQVVQKGGTSTAVASSVNPSVNGQRVSFQARVSVVSPSRATPSGTYAFSVDGHTISGCEAVALSSGVANCSATFTTAVPESTVKADYSGDDALSGSSGSLVQKVVKADTSTAVRSSAGSVVSGQSVTYTATVDVVAPGVGTRSGTVTFKDGTTTVPGCGSVAVDTTTGTAACTTSYASPAGSPHVITALYGGNGALNASTSAAITQAVTQASTTTALSSSANPAVAGQTVVLTAQVAVTAPGAGTPAGTVAFQDGGTALAGCAAAPVDAAGKATCTASFLPAAGASRTLRAVYSGSAALSGSSSADLTQVVNLAATGITFTQSPTPAVPLQPLGITITVAAKAPGTGTPTGTATLVRLDILGIVQETQARTLVDGKATFSTLYLLKGSSYQVTYSGDANYQAAGALLKPQ